VRPLPLLFITSGKGGDCGIVALSSFLGAPYDKVLKAARKVCVRPEVEGMFDSNIIATAKRLGFSLRRKQKVEESDAGILCLGNRRKLRNGQEGFGHFVVLQNWLIFDSTEVWDFDDYFKRHPRYHIRAIITPDLRKTT
jgi:hypothetical protein